MLSSTSQNIAWERTEHVEDVVKVGGTVTVKIIKIDEKGRIDASIKALLPKPEKLDEWGKWRRASSPPSFSS